MPKKHVVIDPIHGKIEMPQWLVRIKDQPSIRRMMGIKQLGLKAFIDFPGAIHTRYLHSLGTMDLAGELSDLLVKKEKTRTPNRSGLIEDLASNRECLMAAAFFHDIGHGPFSHVLDFVLQKECGKDHEWMATQIVKRFKSELGTASIPPDQVCKIITKKHKYPFLYGIINGPLDVDKVDYVLRDSYYVGYQYSFDLDSFFDQIAILGDENELEKCELGLENSREAIACAELFLLLWRSMYTLVYFKEPSRIAEKMLEKAVLTAIENKSSLADDVKDVEKYVNLDEDTLIRKLRESHGFPEEICDRILKTADLYSRIYENDLSIFRPSIKFMDALSDSADQVSDKISRSLSKLEHEPYSIICDIILMKTPKNIHIDEKDKDGEPIEIKQRSDVVKSISTPEMVLKVYANPKIKKMKTLVEAKAIKTEIQKLIDGWV